MIKNLIDCKINGSEAATQLELSIRQTKRLKALVLKSGIEALAHSNRGKTSNRKINSNILEKVKKYLKEKYADFKPSFACEKLSEIHNIKIGREKIRQIMIAENLWKPRPRKGAKKKGSSLSIGVKIMYN